MTTATKAAYDVRHKIEVFLAPEQRFDVRCFSDDELRGGFSEYGEVRLVVFHPGEPTATMYVNKRRKRTQEVMGSGKPVEFALDQVPVEVRQAALDVLVAALQGATKGSL